jgi:hypothetical protein
MLLTNYLVGEFLLPSILESAASNPTQAPLDPTVEKILIAIVTATLSLITGYILFQIKESKEPKKRLSYDLEARHGLIDIEESIARDVSLTYKGTTTEKLTYVRCDVRNTGNTVIKSEFLRFEFPFGCRVLDSYMEPIPPREYKVSQINEDGLAEHERKYLVGHLEKQQQVGFRFVISDAGNTETKLHPFNDEGDVEVLKTVIASAADDRREIERFVYLFIIGLILPPGFRFLPRFLGDIAQILVYLLLATAMIPLVKPFSRSIATVIASLGSERQPSLSIGQVNQADRASISIAIGQDNELNIATDIPRPLEQSQSTEQIVAAAELS